MPTFGFSAFLKIVNLPIRPQRTELRKRVRPPEKKGGYDFHKATRGLCNSFLVDGATVEEVLASAKTITKAAERKSAIAALRRLFGWRALNLGEIVPVPPIVYESPTGLFKVNFTADFGIRIGADVVAVHIWNTMSPPLDRRLVRAALALFADAYPEGPASDLAVLSLRNGELFRLGEVSDVAPVATAIIGHLEEVFVDLRDGGTTTGGEDRPPPPGP